MVSEAGIAARTFITNRSWQLEYSTSFVYDAVKHAEESTIYNLQ